MSVTSIILAILLVAAIGLAGWFFVAHRLKVRDTAAKITDAIKESRQ